MLTRLSGASIRLMIYKTRNSNSYQIYCKLPLCKNTKPQRHINPYNKKNGRCMYVCIIIIITLVVVVDGEIVSDRIKKTENNTVL